MGAPELKVGDRVKLISSHFGDSSSNPVWDGSQGRIVGTVSEVVTKHDGYSYDINWDNGEANTSYRSGKHIKKVSSSTPSIMDNLVKKFQLLTMSEPQKSFVKAGIADANGNLTDEGSLLFEAWLLKKNQDAFKTEVVDLLTADDKAAKA